MKHALSQEEIQSCLLEILKYIRDVCKQNGLRYYLAYGTLIGAVRDQNLIPWDDDADIHMPRDDYESFLKIVTENPHPYYKLVSRETNPKYNRLWPRIVDTRTKTFQRSGWVQSVPVGLFVDIFILDGAGDSYEEAEETFQSAYAVFRHYERAVTKMFYLDKRRFISFLKWIHRMPEKIPGAGYWMDKHIAYCKNKKYDSCEYVGALGAGTSEPFRNIWKKECFAEGTDLILNGETFSGPADWDAVLRPEYGDYLTLPPVEERHPKHNYKVLYLP